MFCIILDIEFRNFLKIASFFSNKFHKLRIFFTVFASLGLGVVGLVLYVSSDKQHDSGLDWQKSGFLFCSGSSEKLSGVKGVILLVKPKLSTALG